MTDARNRPGSSGPRPGLPPTVLMNCWEIKKCGREAGGALEARLGRCPACPDRGHSCWMLTGTLCGGEVQGTFAQKEMNCLTCEVYRLYNIRTGTQRERLINEHKPELAQYLNGGVGVFEGTTTDEALALAARGLNTHLEMHIQARAQELLRSNRQLQDEIEERKRTEQALRDSEARYRSVIAAIAEGVVLRDPDARIGTCNASAERILGKTLEQMRGSTCYDSSWQAIREDASPFPAEELPIRVALRTGQLQSNVVQGLRKPDGTVLWLSMNVQPLFNDSDRTLTGVVSTLTDITERKQAELRQTMEHAVTRVLADSETLAHALPMIIQTICETLGWACGAHWRWDETAQVLRCAETWHIEAADVADFIAIASNTINEAPAWHGEAPRAKTAGLVRRVWMDGAPVWFPDVTREPGFRRGLIAAKAGLHSAFGFPVMAGAQPLGVMEFFGRTIEHPDEALLQVVRAIGSQIGQFMARRQAEERIRHLASHDELTGLPNRTMFHERLSHALARAQRRAGPLAILFIDLDRFKNVNDTLGHKAGDHVLKEFAERLRGCLRDCDTVSRLGGDEFVILIEGMSQLVTAAGVAQRILDALERPFILDTREFHLGASIGISAFPDDGRDMLDLLKNADAAMYRAKEQGRSNYQFYSAQMNIHLLERLEMESDLRHALERKEFLLHYQPKTNIVSGQITSMEALVRWQHPTRGLISPMEFIPLAEETGLIVPIGEWVLKTACAQNKCWHEQGLPPLRIAVNLSARQFAHENLLQDVKRVLDETGLDPVLLELEITESMVMKDPVHAVKLLTELKAMGIHLSIDDFGTGYSSLSYLKRFPIDSLKIDRSFIRDLPGDADDGAITRAILAMAQSLKLNVIAEGVETEDQLRFLREHGCNEMQGYYFSKPVPEHEFARLMVNHAASRKSVVAMPRSGHKPRLVRNAFYPKSA